MIVSHEHRFIFLKTLKTAGTSVEIALSSVCGPDDIMSPISPADEELRRERGGRGPQNYESPPLPRRAFAHMRARGVRDLVGADTWRDYYTFAIERNPWDAVVSLYFWVQRNRAPIGFDEFVQQPRIAELARRNAQIYRLRGQIAVDRVCRYESLTDDIAEVWSRLSLPGEPGLPRAKAGVRPDATPYRDFYTPASRDLVGQHFADAIRDFDYEF